MGKDKEHISLEQDGIVFDVVFSWDNDDRNERSETTIHTIKIGDTPNLYDVLHEDVIDGLYDQLEAM
jgi:hypothetical protein